MPADAAPQPRSSEKPDEPALVTAMFSRRLAEPLARLCVRLGIPANAVTVANSIRLSSAPYFAWIAS